LKVNEFSQDLLREKIHPSLIKHKLDLIDFAFTLQGALSFSDLGGVWGVDGGYTFYALEKFNPAIQVNANYLTFRCQNTCILTNYLLGNFG
jgi:hypothetical protein